MRLIVFDSGLGGEIVARRLARLHPKDEIITVLDQTNLPYGNKPPKTITRLCETALLPYFGHSNVIVLACNSATATSIDYLRRRYSDEVFVGFEPMIKPAAAATRSRVIAVLATPATLRSQRYQILKRRWAADCWVLEPDCADWAERLENDSFNPNEARDLTEKLISRQADQLVLACTHFIKLTSCLRRQAGSRARILEPIHAVNARLDYLAGAPGGHPLQS